MATGERPLTKRQAAFVEEYLVDLNASAAAVRAGYSKQWGRTHASHLMSNPKIKAAVDDAMRRRAQRVQVDADTVLRELLRIAMADLGQIFDEDGKLKPLHEIPEEARRAICSVETDELFDDGIASDELEPQGHGGALRRHRNAVGVTRKVKLWDKLKALEMLGKHLKLFTDVHEHHVTADLADRLKAARERAKG